jgi:outer membrane biosynthesis protein TonB
MDKGTINGIILISAVVTTDGKLDQVRVVKSSDADVDRTSIETPKRMAT